VAQLDGFMMSLLDHWKHCQQATVVCVIRALVVESGLVLHGTKHLVSSLSDHFFFFTAISLALERGAFRSFNSFLDLIESLFRHQSELFGLVNILLVVQYLFTLLDPESISILW